MAPLRPHGVRRSSDAPALVVAGLDHCGAGSSATFSGRSRIRTGDYPRGDDGGTGGGTDQGVPRRQAEGAGTGAPQVEPGVLPEGHRPVRDTLVPPCSSRLRATGLLLTKATSASDFGEGYLRAAMRHPAEEAVQGFLCSVRNCLNDACSRVGFVGYAGRGMHHMARGRRQSKCEEDRKCGPTRITRWR